MGGFRGTLAARARVMRVLSAALLLLLPAVAFAQQGQVPYIETLEVRVHNVDVIVTDARGNAVAGLTRDDFEVREDGALQEISNFSAYGGTRATTLAATSEARPARKFIFYVDEMSLTAPTQATLHKQLDHLLDRAMGAGDEGMVVRPAELKKLASPFTSDREALRSTLHQTIASETWRATSPISREIHQLEIEMNTAGSNRSARIAARRWTGFVRARVKQRLGQLSAVVNAASEVQGRKVLVLVTESLPIAPGREAFNGLRDRPRDVEVDSTDIVGDEWADMAPFVDEIARSAAENNIVMYPLQAEYGSGLAAPGGDIGALRGANAYEPRTSQTRPPTGAQFVTFAMDLAENTEGTMRRLAEKTGGTWYRGALSVDNLVNDIVRDVESYYSLGFRASDAVDQPHKLDVRVKGRPELHVRTRQEVIRKSPEREMTDRVVAGLLEPAVESNELGIRLDAKVAAVASDRSYKTVYVAARVPLSSLTFLPDGDVYKAKFSVHYAASGEQSDFVSGIAGPQVVEVPAADFAKAQTQQYTYVVPLNLRPANHTVVVGVLDSISHLSGFAKTQLSVR